MIVSSPEGSRGSTCCDASLAAAEPLEGTATQGANWLAFEFRGAWGRDAAADSGLPEATAAALTSFAGRALAIRRPDRRRAGAVVYRAETTEEGGTLVRHVLPGLDAVADPAALEGGDPVPGSIVLVCTHGRRDPCCARLGRPLFDALESHCDPDRLWQSSHLGGHRFAANVLVLPAGVQLGRVSPGDAGRVASLLGDRRIPLEHYRGRTLYAPRVQAAEVAVRRRLGIDEVAGLWAARTNDAEVTFAHAAGEITVHVEERPGPVVPPSCGAEPEPTLTFAVSF